MYSTTTKTPAATAKTTFKRGFLLHTCGTSNECTVLLPLATTRTPATAETIVCSIRQITTLIANTITTLLYTTYSNNSE